MTGVASHLRALAATTTTLERHQHDVKTVRELCGVVGFTIARDVWVVAWRSRFELVNEVRGLVATSSGFNRAVSASMTDMPPNRTEMLTIGTAMTLSSDAKVVFAVVRHCGRHVNGCGFS